MDNLLTSTAKRLCEGINGFKLSPYQNGQPGNGLAFNKGQDPTRREISIRSWHSTEIEISFTHWSRPGNFDAADRVRVKCKFTLSEVEAVLRNAARDFDDIIREYRFFRSGGGYNLSGEMSFEKFMELERHRLSGETCHGCGG